MSVRVIWGGDIAVLEVNLRARLEHLVECLRQVASAFGDPDELVQEGLPACAEIAAFFLVHVGGYAPVPRAR